MIQMNLFTKQKWTHRHKKQSHAHKRERELGMTRYAALYIKETKRNYI